MDNILLWIRKIITTCDKFSEAIDSRDDIKALLLSKIISNEDTTEIDFTFEEKNEFQITVEKELIEKQDEIDVAIDSQDIVKIREIEKEIFKSKRNFNSLEFELELKRLFDETADELWIISPWIKKATMKRIPFFENYLKKGGKIFIVYSLPEAEDQLMALEEPLNKLLELEKNYQNFYIHQLPPFHYKNVWLRMKDNNNFYYTGSYNILSFFVMQGLKHIRQEKMTRIDWNNETEDEYNEVFKKFGLKYITKAIDDFNSISQDNSISIDKDFIQKIKNIDNGKLRPFINKGIEEFDKAYNELEIAKNANLDSSRRYFFNQIIIKFQKQVTEYKKDLITPDKKRRLQSEFEKERADYMDLVDMQLGVVKDLFLQINNLKTYNLNKSVIKKNFKR